MVDWAFYIDVDHMHDTSFDENDFDVASAVVD